MRTFSGWLVVLGVVVSFGCGDDDHSGGRGGSGGVDAGEGIDAGGTGGSGGKGGEGAAGMGGTDGAAGMGGTDGAVPDGSGGMSRIVGSYDVEVRSVSLVAEEHCDYSSGDRTALSKSLQARLDITVDDEGVRAVFTPRWGESSVLEVEVEADTVVLTGEAVVGSIECSSGLSESWTRVVIDRQEDGSLGSRLTFSGVGPCYQMGSIVNIEGVATDMTGEATLDPDETPPEVRLTFSATAGDDLLPWSMIELALAESLDRQDLLASLLVTAFDDGSAGEVGIPVEWEFSPQGELDAEPDSVIAVNGRFTDWESVAGRSVTVSIGDGVADEQGNALAPLAVEKPVLDPGEAAEAHDLGDDGESLEVAVWNDAGRAGADAASLCEQGDCVWIEGTGGIAALLARGSADQLTVRYRILGRDPYYVPSSDSTISDVSGQSIAVRVFDSSTGASVASGGSTGNFSLLADPVARGDRSWSWATGWQDLVVDLPEEITSDTVGLVVGVDDSAWRSVSALQSCGIDAIPPTFMSTSVLVERIAVP